MESDNSIISLLQGSNIYVDIILIISMAIPSNGWM